MNSSAKYIFSLLAAGTLGAVAFACTVSSGTIDDTDGGSNTPGTSSGTVDTDAGDAGQTGTTCSQLTYANTIDSADCEACLEQNCCSETAGCWNKADDTDAGQGKDLGCESYKNALLDCDEKAADGVSQADIDECKRVSGTVTQDGVTPGYTAYQQCRLANCNDKCNVGNDTAPDAGSIAQ